MCKNKKHKFLYLEETDDDLCCSICSEAFIEPVILPSCGHSFCSACLESWFTQSKNKTCPIDRSPVNGNPTRNITANNLANKLMVKCQCDWKGRREELQTHLSCCDWESFSCPYAGVGCNAPKMKKRDIKHHLEICSYEKVKELVSNYKHTKLENEILKVKLKQVDLIYILSPNTNPPCP